VTTFTFASFCKLCFCLFISTFFFFVFSAITNIIFAYPQPVRRIHPGVRVPQVGNHCPKIRNNAE
jgi:hypothetical protein